MKRQNTKTTSKAEKRGKIEKKMYINSPLEQFEIIPVIRIYNNFIDFTINNSTIFMGISIIFIISIIKITNTNKIIGRNWQNTIEIIYTSVEKEIKEMLKKKGYKYIPFILTIFIFILINNIIGLIPYSFTTTSHFIVTITFSLSLFIGYTIIGIKRYGIKFINLFIPSGVPKFLIPLLFIIEIISYFSRIISLAVRLAANLIGGHSILKIIAGFGMKLSKWLLFIPLIFLTLLMGLETMVAIIQAYIFVVLLTTYIKDAEYLH